MTRYAFVIRWPDGREPELATRGGRLVVSEDKAVLCPPYEPVVFSGDLAGTVGVADEPASERAAEESPASLRVEPDRLREVRKFGLTVRVTDEQITDALQEACVYMRIDPTGLSDEEMQARIDAHMSELYAAIGRRFDEAFGRTPDQLTGHPLVQPKETP